MFDDRAPDLERLLALRVWHATWLARIDNKIADIQRRQAERKHGRRVRHLPASVLSETLGISIAAALKWTRRAARDWNAYLAARPTPRPNTEPFTKTTSAPGLPHHEMPS
ncbi:hypothetical protein [Streptomyces massasporeus]|uniref:hypothetical protein n=1 Tax=Streptomyces massasporeus TaxID=67324 RepID=UPI0037F4FB11